MGPTCGTVRLAFLLVLSLVGIGVARGDFGSGEARSEEAGPLTDHLARPDSVRADSTAPEASGVDALLGRVRGSVAP